MAKETFYFSHDYNARTDTKIKKLIVKHGFTGYGIYWAIVEDLYQNANALQTDYECIAYDMRVDAQIVKSIIEDFELFHIEGNYFGSLSIQRRIEERDAKSQKARESAFYRWNKDKNDANAMRTHSECNAIKDSIINDNKENNNKEENKSDKPTHTLKFIKPTIDEIKEYCTLRNNRVDAIKFFNFYESKGWMVGKNKMKDWQAAVRNWETSDNSSKKQVYNNDREVTKF